MSELCSSDWVGKASILMVEVGFQETFIRAGLDVRNTVVQAGRLAERILWEVQFV